VYGLSPWLAHCPLALSSQGLFSVCVYPGVSSSYNDMSYRDQGLTLKALFNFHYLFKGSISKHSHMEG
jgi:hypothetical protein